jgi:hypothetical protein
VERKYKNRYYRKISEKKKMNLKREIQFLNSLTSKGYCANATVNRERRFPALLLQNHPKSIGLFDHSENNLT